MTPARRSDVAFSSAVKQAQARAGSRDAYARGRDWSNTLPPDLVDYIQQRDTAFLATASADGQPYVQHRGGPPGFLAVLDPQTLAFADYAGNRQYISVGNLSENPRIMMILMDFPARRRLKIWGRAEIREAPPALPPGMVVPPRARVERLVLVHIEAWDLNCPQHITPRYTRAELAALDTPTPETP